MSNGTETSSFIANNNCFYFKANIGVLDSIVSELPEPTVEEHDLMKRISKKVRFQYDPETFSNPTLQSFYKTLEALIYEEEEQPSDDFTLPDVDAQDAKIEPFLEDILAEFGSVSGNIVLITCT